MVAAQTEEPHPMTETAYLVFEDESEIKHEFSGGQVYAMTGGSVRHGVITANTIIHLGNQLSNRNCSVIGSDVRVHIKSKGAYRYPDVMVFCGEPAYREGRTDTITNPIVLVEVLSPSTAVTDRNEKLEEYFQILSLQAYLLVSQDNAKVERFLRHESGQWLYQYVTGLGSEIDVPPLDCTLALAKIYQRVTFD